MSEELNIRSLSVAAAAKLLKVHPKVVRLHIRRGLPRVKEVLPLLRQGVGGLRRPRKRIDMILYGAWMNQQEEKAKASGT